MASPRTPSSSGIAELVLLGVVWGATFPIARLGVDAGANPFLLVTLDLLIAAAVTALVAGARSASRPAFRYLGQSAGLGALLIGGINLPLYWGLRFATGSSAAIVYATAPIISLLVIRLIGPTVRIDWRQALALALGLGGVVLLGVGSTSVIGIAGVGALAAFALGAVCQGTGATLVGRARPQGEDPWGLTFQFLGAGVASLVVLLLVARSPALPLTLPVLGSMAYVGILAMAVGYFLFFDLVHRFGAVRANQVTFLNPVVALLVGVLVLGERFEPIEAVALALILVALLLLQPTSRPRVPLHVSARKALSDAKGLS